MTPTNDTNQDTTAKLLPAHADIEAQGTTASCKYWRDSGARPKRLQQALAASKALPNAFYHVLVIFRRTAKAPPASTGGIQTFRCQQVGNVLEFSMNLIYRQLDVNATSAPRHSGSRVPELFLCLRLRMDTDQFFFLPT